MPLFVANGDTDILVSAENSFVLHRKIPGSSFHIYPDAGQTFLFNMGCLCWPYQIVLG